MKPNPILDIAERVLWTFIQTFVVTLLATGSSGLHHFQDWVTAAAVGALAGVIAVLTSLAKIAMPPLSGLAEVAWRTVATFVQVFLGALVAGHYTSILDADWKSCLALAFPAAIFACLKALAALGIPFTYNASTVSTRTGTTVDRNN